MSNRFLQKYKNGAADSGIDSGAAEEIETADDFGTFGWLRGIRDRAAMLELRKANGNILAVGYGWLERVEFDPSDGITLHFVGHKIRIQGRHLNSEARPHLRLFQGLVRHKVPWIQEADRATVLEADKSATVVEIIEW